jgi:valine dehydrogenase (NAD+)
VQSLSGRYVTACDVGTYPQDLDVVAETCDHVTGRSVAGGGLGDSSVLTADGVLHGMRAAAQFVWGGPESVRRRIGVAGVGKVGGHLVHGLVQAGAEVLVTDVDADAVQRTVASPSPGDRRARRPDAGGAPLDVYAPCALGGAIDDVVADLLQASVVCGGANNQLAHPGVGNRLHERESCTRRTTASTPAA